MEAVLQSAQLECEKGGGPKIHLANIDITFPAWQSTSFIALGGIQSDLNGLVLPYLAAVTPDVPSTSETIQSAKVLAFGKAATITETVAAQRIEGAPRGQNIRMMDPVGQRQVKQVYRRQVRREVTKKGMLSYKRGESKHLGGHSLRSVK